VEQYGNNILGYRFLGTKIFSDTTFTGNDLGEFRTFILIFFLQLWGGGCSATRGGFAHLDKRRDKFSCVRSLFFPSLGGWLLFWRWEDSVMLMFLSQGAG